MQLQWAILSACVLLLAGFTLRARLRTLQLFFVPASVVGGMLGLAVVQATRAAPEGVAWIDAVAATLRGWPGPLIAVVFAGLLLDRPGRGFTAALRGAAREGVMVWVIVVGEVALGLLVTWLLIMPFFEVPAAFGQLIEAGFAGGHGTATALGVIFEESLAFPEGRDLGLAMATAGLVWSVVSGIVFVNIGVRRGWLRGGGAAGGRGGRPPDPVKRVPAELVTGLEARRAPTPAAYARVSAGVIDPLVFQMLLVAAAFAIGLLLQWVFVQAAGAVSTDEMMRFIGNVPLFLFTLLGGWAVRAALSAIGLDDLIDGDSIRRIVAVAMEFLIVAAIASLRVETLGAYLGPLALLCAAGFGWTAFCLFFLARRILPAEHWFELGIINYGMSTGTTAQGMMLLRIVDPDLETGASEEYALAAPLSAPFIGGGVVTMTLPLLLLNVHVGIVAGGLAAVVAALACVGTWVNRRG